MSRNGTKWIQFFIVGIGVVACYLIFIGLYTRLSRDPILFFVSLTISLGLSAGAGVLLY